MKHGCNITSVLPRSRSSCIYPAIPVHHAESQVVLYAKKDATDQPRQIHGVSTRVVSKEEVDGLYIVTVGAVDRAGRQDEDVGAVQIKGLVGDARANAMMKAITKGNDE